MPVPFLKERYDWFDFALRAAVLIPFMALYGYWVFDVLRVAWRALTGQA